LISLAVVGALMALQSKSQGPASAAVTQESQALVAAASANFSTVDQLLQVDYAQAGTYVGAQLPAGSGVTLAQAGTTSYCLQTNLNGTFVHEVGPGGSPSAGTC
jgi:hypothetical protein